MSLYEDLKSNQVYVPEGVRKIYEAVMKEGRSVVMNDLSLDNDFVPSGALFVDGRSFKMKVKQGGKLAAISPNNIFDPETVTDTVIARNSVNGDRIKQRTLSKDRLMHQTITSNEIENNTILGSKIASEAIENRHLKDNIIDTDKIKDGSITGEKIRDLSVDENHIKDNAIRQRHIRSEEIIERHLANESVAADKIKHRNIMSYHIENNNILSQHILDKQVLENHLADESVSTIKMRPLAVDSSRLKDSSVIESKIMNASVSREKIKDQSVDYNKLDEKVKKRIESSLDISTGVGTLPVLNATERIITRDATISQNLKAGAIETTGNLTVGGKIHSKGDISTDGVIYRAGFNDLAEGYVPGQVLEPGDIVQIEEDGKVYKSEFLSSKTVGVVSDCYADCYGASLDEIEMGYKIPVGMIGRVPVKVIGSIEIGQYIIPGDYGIAYVSDTKNEYTIGKALESSNEQGVKRVLCLIYPN